MQWQTQVGWATIQQKQLGYVQVIHEVNNYTATQRLATAGSFHVSTAEQSAERRGSVLAHLRAFEDRCTHVGVLNRGVQLSCLLLTRLLFPPGYRLNIRLYLLCFFIFFFFLQLCCAVVFLQASRNYPSPLLVKTKQNKTKQNETWWLVSRAVKVVSLECYT